MTHNSTHRYDRTVLLGVERVEAPVVVTSAELDERLADVYQSTGLRSGMLESLVGIRERRGWGDGSFVDGAVAAGRAALEASGVAAEDIGLMINTSLSREWLEPSTAVVIHDALGLPPGCQNFDVTNACLGFMNGMEIAAAMIESGLIDHALVVDSEDSQPVQEATIARLSAKDDVTANDLMEEFAALTLGSGAVAMVLGRADQHPEGHRLVGGVSRAATQHHGLCVGDNNVMKTDLKGLLEAGLDLSSELWAEAASDFGWETGIRRYFLHQISQVHTEAICERLDIEPDRAPRSFPEFGNIGPASVAFTMAGNAEDLEPGDRVLLLGIGSGLNASCLEIVW